MKKSKTCLAKILCIVMCICLMAGCGGRSGNNTDVSQGDAQQDSSTGSGTAGSGASAQSSVAEEDEEIYYAEAIIIICDGDISTLDPMRPAAITIPAVWAFTMIHDRLLARDHETGSVGSAIATHWNSSDNRTFRFTLRDDAVFHDGEKLTASDLDTS